MKIKFFTIASAVLLAVGYSLTVSAGSIADTDTDHKVCDKGFFIHCAVAVSKRISI